MCVYVCVCVRVCVYVCVYGRRTYQCIIESRKNIHENMIEFREHCSSVYRPGEGPRGGGGRRREGEPQDPEDIRGIVPAYTVQGRVPGEGEEGGDRERPRTQPKSGEIRPYNKRSIPHSKITGALHVLSRSTK